MTIVHLLIDYESIQPKDLEALARDNACVTVFVGPQQQRLPFDFVAAMQTLGAAGRYVKVAALAKNALDFHLAFYLGELMQQDPTGTYRILSRDRGFDVLITHLRGRGFQVERVTGAPSAPDAVDPASAAGTP